MKTVVITGGSSGIGLAMAKLYCQQDYNVVLVARNEERLNKAVNSCKALCKEEQKVLSFSVDTTNKEALNACAQEIHTSLGQVDILVLSAGIVDCKRMIDHDDESFEKLFKTNVVGARLAAKAFLPHMIENKSGHICFVGSLGGLISTYGYSTYGATKFALMGLAGAMRKELVEHNVGVSVLCPGEVATEMTANEADIILPQTRFVKDIGGTLSADYVARSAIKGIKKNQFIIVPGFKSKNAYWFSRVFPKTFAGVMQLAIKFSSRK
ncbi:MAG: SDR family NAD(P)-dependent oxidoreductase [Colwellia sp.]